MNPLKAIKNEDDFEEEANDRLDGLLNSMQGDKRFLERMNEDDLEYFADQGIIEWWTGRATRLIENYIRRLHKVGKANFPGVEFEIENQMYQEL